MKTQKQKTAEQRKQEELYGNTVKKHQVGKKGDGTLMGAGADWRNLNQTHTNAKTRNQDSHSQNAMEKKHKNLQSSILAHTEEKNEQMTFDPEQGKAQYATVSGWAS